MISIKVPQKDPKKDPDVWALRAPIKIVLYDFHKRPLSKGLSPNKDDLIKDSE